MSLLRSLYELRISPLDAAEATLDVSDLFETAKASVN
jgi:hypothetical protein